MALAGKSVRETIVAKYDGFFQVVLSYLYCRNGHCAKFIMLPECFVFKKDDNKQKPINNVQDSRKQNPLSEDNLQLLLSVRSCRKAIETWRSWTAASDF